MDTVWNAREVCVLLPRAFSASAKTILANENRYKQDTACYGVNVIFVK